VAAEVAFPELVAVAEQRSLLTWLVPSTYQDAGFLLVELVMAKDEDESSLWRVIAS